MSTPIICEGKSGVEGTKKSSFVGNLISMLAFPYLLDFGEGGLIHSFAICTVLGEGEEDGKGRNRGICVGYVDLEENRLRKY